MAVITSAFMTMLDRARRIDPDGKIATITELLSQFNEMLTDLATIEGNLPNGHVSTQRTGIPEATWRKFNSGVQPVNSTTAQVTDTCGMLETYSKIDKKLADLNGNAMEFRASEDVAIIEGMTQTLAKTVLYGDTDVNPERFMGLTPRFSVPSDDTDEAGSNIIDGGGDSTDNASIWLVCSAPQIMALIHPKGSQVGINMENLGQDTATDASGNEHEIYRTHYELDVGLMLKDWRFVVRIANIKRSALTKDASAGADIIDLMIRASERIPNPGIGRCAWWMDRQLRSFLRRQIKNDDGMHLTYDTVEGKRVLAFDEIPVRRVDALKVNEALVSGTFCED